MSNMSDDAFFAWQAQSDKAFFEMQRKADQEMENFLASCQSMQGSIPETSPSIFSKQTVLSPQGSTKPRQYPERIGVNKDAFSAGLSQVKRGLEQHSEHVPESIKEATNEFAVGTSDLLKSSANNLGQKAKQEALKLKEAMLKAMQEERSLSGLKERAAQEAKQAKQRMQQNFQDSKAEASAQIRAMAQEQFVELAEEGSQALEQGFSSLEKEWGDLKNTQDP